jgi:hypothetical protein
VIRRVTLIMGLPGSGKSTLAETMAAPRVLVLDDYSKRIEENVLKVFGLIWAVSPCHLVLTDVMAMRSKPEAITDYLRRNFGREVEIDIIAFENDPEVCWANVERRQDGRVIDRKAFLGMSRDYDPRTFTEDVRSVYRKVDTDPAPLP